MNLALEYIIRSPNKHLLIEYPCSLLLEHEDNGKKLIITLNSSNEEVIVKHWSLSNINPKYVMPFFREYVIKKEDAFNSDKTILRGYTSLRFCENLLSTGRRQYSDMPFAITQSNEYEDTVKSFYQPEVNLEKRQEWLWSCFRETFQTEFTRLKVPTRQSSLYYASTRDLFCVQTDSIKKKNKRLWHIWKIWYRYFLDFTNKIATELLFMSEYTEVRPHLRIEHRYESWGL